MEKEADLLPLGSVVRLNNGTSKLVVTGRLPLYQEDGDIQGYFEYVAALHPVGMTDSRVAYFNNRDIAEVIFRGYEDEADLKYKEQYISSLNHGGLPYKQLDVRDVQSDF